MTSAMLPLGVMPQELWPQTGKSGYAVRRWRQTDTFEILLHTHKKGGTIPLHIYQADRFMLVTKGYVTIISQKSCIGLEEGEAIIIRAMQPHGFIMPNETVHYLTVSMGPGHAAPNLLPAHIQKMFNPIAHDPMMLRAFQHAPRWTDPYSELEHETIEWVRNSLLGETPSPLTFHMEEQKVFPMRGWKVGGHSWIVKVRHRAVSVDYEERESVPRLRVREVFAFGPGLDRKDPHIGILK